MMSDSQSQRIDRQDSSIASEHQGSESKLTWLIPVSLFLVLALLYWAIPDIRQFLNKGYQLLSEGSRVEFEAWIKGFGAWGPIVIVLMMLLQTFAAFIPSILIMVVSVLSYGPFWGSALSWGGLLIAAALAYSLGRFLGPVTLQKLMGQKTEARIEGVVEAYGVWAVIAARVAPFLSTDAVSFVAGLVKMRWYVFLTATAVGILPLILLIAFLGRNIERLEAGLWWVTGISVVIFLGYVVYKKYFQTENKAS